MLDRLRTVYAEWGVNSGPFDDIVPRAGERREDPRAFVIALVAGVVGGLSEAIERNNAALMEALERRQGGVGYGPRG